MMVALGPGPVADLLGSGPGRSDATTVECATADQQEISCPSCHHLSFGRSHVRDVHFGAFRYQYLRCRSCGSLFADPMPDPVLLAEIYAPAYVEAHYSSDLMNEISGSDLELETLRALNLIARHRPRGRLLDVGCGAGRFIRAAAEDGFDVEGHEMTGGAAAVASERTGRPVHSGPLRDVDGRYDVIHLADVLEHSPRPDVLLRDATTLLAKNGVLLLRGPLENQRNLFQTVTVLRREIRNHLFGHRPVEMPPYHVNLFTLAGWRALIRCAELSTLDEEVTEIHWPAPGRFPPNIPWAVKIASLALSRSRLGRRFSFGNRVMGLFAPNAPNR